MTSTLVFEDRVTKVGTQAIGNLTDLLARELDQATQIHGENSREAAASLLALSSINQTMEPSEEAHEGIRRYLATSNELYGPHSIEVAVGYFLLGWSHAGLGREEDAKLAIERSFSLPGGKRDFAPLEPMIEALCGLLDQLQDSPEPESARMALVLGVHTLSWLVTYCNIQSPSFPVFLGRLRPAFESRGFRGDTWEWLLRRCNGDRTDFAGLISVLLEEKLVTVGINETDNSDEDDPEGNFFVRGYEIAGIKDEHWTSDEGFSKGFPIIVAEGELSLRLERLLAEGCRCLRTTGQLGTVFLIFSSNWLGKRVTAFGTTTWSDEEKVLMENTVREKMSELGADSAMMLAWVEQPHAKSAERGEEPPEAVMVVAKDAKSYLRGFQPARKVDGQYVFDEPMVVVAENTWFSEFTFPVQPTGDVPPQGEADKRVVSPR